MYLPECYENAVFDIKLALLTYFTPERLSLLTNE